MRKTQDFEIDGIVYQATQLKTSVGQPLGLKLVKALGPAIVKFLDAIPNKKELVQKFKSGADNAGVLGLLLDDAMAKGMGDAFLAALNGASPELVDEATRAFLVDAKFKTDETPGFLPLKAVYDDHFAGEYVRLMNWFLTNTRFNFAGFFPSSASSTSTDETETTTES